MRDSPWWNNRVYCVTWFHFHETNCSPFVLEERHWPEAVPGRREPGGGEVCSHARHVDVPRGVCGGRIRLRGGQIPGRRPGARLHAGGQSGTRKVCARGKCAQGLETPGLVLSRISVVDKLTCTMPKPWGLIPFRWCRFGLKMLRSTSGRAGSKRGWEFSNSLCSGSWKWGFWKKTSVRCFLGYFQSSVCEFS